MNLRILLIAIFTVSLLSTRAQSVGLDVGAPTPLGDLSELYSTGLSLELKVLKNADLDDNFQYYYLIGYTTLSPKIDSIPSLYFYTELSDFKSLNFGYGINFRFSQSNFSPRAGLDLITRIQFFSGLVESFAYVVALRPSIGVSYDLNPFQFTLDLKYELGFATFLPNNSNWQQTISPTVGIYYEF